MCIRYKHVHAKCQSFSILLIDMTFLNLEIPPSLPIFHNNVQNIVQNPHNISSHSWFTV